MREFIRSRITDAGRVVIPAELRREYGLADGEEVVFCRGANGIELLNVSQALKRAQDEVRAYIPGDDVDLTDELLAARKSLSEKAVAEMPNDQIPMTKV